MQEQERGAAAQQQPCVGSLFGGCCSLIPPTSQTTQPQQSPPTPASADILVADTEDPEAEAIARAEVMEQARLAAEERARLDEEEWHEEEERLREEEEWRRQARAAREEEQQQRETAALEAERRELGLDDELMDANLQSGPSFAELLSLEGNQHCFDCDTGLGSGGGEDGSSGSSVDTSMRGIWWSLTHGTLLCTECAQVHRTLGTETSVVVRATEAHSSAMESDLDVLYAGGNDAFAAFLGEEAMGVPRRVWLALPIDARYQTPAAELYSRRLQALVNGEDTLPSDMRKPTEVVTPPPPPAVAAAELRVAPEAPAPAAPDGERRPPRWEPPDSGRVNDSTTDYLTAMNDMRRRIEAAKEKAARAALG